MLPFLEVAEVLRAKRKIQKSAYIDDGPLRVVDQGEGLVGGYTEDLDARYMTNEPLIIFGDHTCRFKYIDFPFAPGADGTQLFRAKPQHDTRYLYYACHALGLEHYGYQRHFKHLKALKLPVYLLETERQIASILSAYDDLIENNTRRIAILEEMAQRLYEEWFVQFRFPGHEDATFIETEHGRVPEGWNRCRLRDIVDFVKVSARPGDHLSDREYVPIDCIGRRTLALQEVKLWTEAQSGLILFEEDDILFGAMAPHFHKVAIAPFSGVTRSTCFVFRSKISMQWAFSILTAFRDETIAYASAHSKGATIPYAVWAGSLEDLEVLAPSDLLIEAFEKKAGPMLHWVKRQFRINANLRAQRDLLLPKLVSGEINVSEVGEVLEEVVA